jgi:2-polyprenyl-3-methyl-5-hydroxy-6-metoxy-1,4-benzoquinol methylase
MMMSPPDYYKMVRAEIAPLLPAKATRVLDLGCGTGLTSKWLKRRYYPTAHIVGVDGHAAILPELSKNVDDAHIVNLNDGFPEIGAPDLVLCLDILEHLVDPDTVLRRVVSAMADYGTIIISLPNIAYIRVAAPLFLLGKFDYRDAGILDQTHLRFFTRASTLRLVRGANLDVTGMIRNGLDDVGARRSNRLLNALTGGLLSDRFTEQYILSAQLSPRMRIEGFN